MADPDSGSGGLEDDITAEDLRELVEARKEEVELEKVKQVTRRKELESEERHAKRSLEAQMEDRSDKRDHQNRIHERNSRYGLVIIVLVLIFFGYLVWLGHTEIVYEIVRVLLYGGAGWVAGQSFGRAKASLQSSNANNQ